MLTEEQFQRWVENLQNGPTMMNILLPLIRHPTGDIRILPYLESLLSVKEIHILGIPFEFGELRWLAAHALAAERKAIGVSDPVVIQGVLAPFTTKQITAMSRQAGIKSNKPGIFSYIEELEILREMGKAPLRDLKLQF